MDKNKIHANSQMCIVELPFRIRSCQVFEIKCDVLKKHIYASVFVAVRLRIHKNID